MTDESFASPLAVAHPSRWTAVDFRPLSLDPRIEALADEMEFEIWRIVTLLPPSLASEAARVLSGYPGPGRRFIGLFYRPVWSVLHWLEEDAAVRAAAVRVHALALLLHLWDDHLCDGQLPIDIARLHFRSLAWREMEAALPPDGSTAENLWALLATYLEAIHAPEPAGSLEAHLERFERQMAIWRAAPRMLAARRGARVAALLDEALQHFCVAWRLIDDIQDIEEDRATGQDNCVRLALSGPAAARWDASRGVAPQALPAGVDGALPDAVETILRRAREALRQARAKAAEAGLTDWADEIDRARGF